MSISDNYTPIKTLGNGSTVDFSGNWAVLSASFIRVAFEDVTTGVQTPQLSGWTLVFDESGFTVTFSVAPTSANYVVISREIAQTQTDPYKTSKGFQGAVIENSFDKITGIAQELQNASDRSLKFPVGSSVTNPVLPTPIDGYAILWDGTTGKMRNTDVSLADLEGNAEIVADNITAINTVATNISSVNTVSTNITAVNTVSTNIADVGVVADNIANVNIVAADITDVNTVATNIAAVSDVSTNMTAVVGVYNNLAAIIAVDANEADIQTVAANIVDIQNAEENADRAEAAADALQGTSTTSNSIATGSKSFTTQAAKNFGVGRALLITSDASPAARRMAGVVTAYDSGTGALTVLVDSITGSGTYTDWSIRVTGNTGETGAPGSVTDGDKGDITVTGSGATWTADPTLIQGKSTTAPATGDYMLLSDASGSDALIKATVADILALSGGGAWVKRSTVNANNVASVDFTNLTGKAYRLDFTGLRPASDGQYLRLNVSTNNGGLYNTLSTNTKNNIVEGSTSYGGASSATSNISEVTGNASTESVSGFVEIHQCNSSALYKNIIFGVSGIDDTGANRGTRGIASYKSASPVDAIQLLFNSSNIYGEVTISEWVAV